MKHYHCFSHLSILRSIRGNMNVTKDLMLWHMFSLELDAFDFSTSIYEETNCDIDSSESITLLEDKNIFSH